MSINSKSMGGRPKTLINDIPHAVDDAIAGLAMANRGLVILEGQRVVMRRDHSKMSGKVKLISGGGAGHEPAHGGYVGPGMLTAAVYGDIFCSPPSATVLRVIRELGVGHPEGILLIVKNYTGDRLNFGVAMERARNEGIKVKMLVVGEDCALSEPMKATGRRGLAGVVLVHKMAGAMAEQGRNLDDIFTTCRSATMTDMATITIGLHPPIIPGGSFMSVNRLADDEIELGLGIHNEHGVHKIPMGTTAEVVQTMLQHMWNPRSKTAITLDEACPITLLINNLGGSSKLEEQIFAMETIKQFVNQGYSVSRVYCGTFLTSLDSAGFSITAFKMSNPDISKYLDAPTSASAWPRTLCAGCVGLKNAKECELPLCEIGRCIHAEDDAERHKNSVVGPKLSDQTAQSLMQVVTFACEAIVSVEKQLNLLDEEAGDGDCGTTMKRGADGVLRTIKEGHMNQWRPFAILEHISTVCESSMGGTSGALYSIFFAASAKPFATMDEKSPVDVSAWLAALHAGNEAIKRYGLAKVGDRTLLDALNAAEEAIKDSLNLTPSDQKGALAKAAAAASKAAKDTIGMPAKIGRACYIGNTTFTQPDPGAYAVGVWMKAINEAVKLTF